MKGATIHFYCLFDESLFQTSVPLNVIIECIKLNWLCKHTKKIRSSQPVNPCTVLSKFLVKQFFPVSIVKRVTMNVQLYQNGNFFISWFKFFSKQCSGLAGYALDLFPV